MLRLERLDPRLIIELFFPYERHALARKVIRQFQTIPPNPIEIDFLGADNKLLSTLFPLTLISPSDPEIVRLHDYF
jgi:hypothetical protein